MAGDASEATASFGRAKDLFGAGQYHDAMRLLVDLDRKYPNTRNILLAMAACLEKIDCLGEAEQICDRLLANGPDPRAVEIKARIHAARNTPDTGGIYAAIDLDPPQRQQVGPPPPATASDDGMSRRRLIIIGAVVLVAVLFVALPLVLGGARRMAAPPAPPVRTATAPPAGNIAVPPAPATATPPLHAPGSAAIPAVIGISAYGIAVIIAVIAFITQTIFLYYYLRSTQRLRGGTAAEDVQDVVVTLVIMDVLMMIPLIGWIFALGYFMHHYDIGCLEVILIGLLCAVVNLIVLAILVLLPLLALGYMVFPAG